MPASLSTYLTPDVMVFAVLIFGSLLYAVMVSRGKLVPILVATYMAFVLVEFVPIELSFLYKLIFFGITFLVVLFILSGVIFQSPVGAETFGVLTAFLFAFLQVGFLLSVFSSFLPPGMIAEFSDRLALVFLHPYARFAWASAPVLLLLLIGRRVSRIIRGDGMDEDYYYDED